MRTTGVVAAHVPITTVPATVAVVRQAEEAGVAAVWLTSGGFGPDSLTTAAIAGASTSRIAIGTSIAVTYSRHPLTMAQQSLAIHDVAPDRFRLGIGVGHRPTIEGAYGLAFDRPAGHLGEYVEVLRQAMAGPVDFSGTRYAVHTKLARSHEVPIYFSALRVSGYRLAGELADGAISWATPPGFLRDVAGPALRASAAERGRPRPALVGHVQGLVTDEPEAAMHAARERLAANTRMTFYQGLFADAGFPEARDGTVPAELMRELVFVGPEEMLARGVERFLDSGCDEVIVSLLPGSGTETERTLRAIGALPATS